MLIMYFSCRLDVFSFRKNYITISAIVDVRPSESACCSRRLLMKVKGHRTLSRLREAELSENTLCHGLSLGGDIIGLNNKTDK